jgi:hypothetical protein
MSALLKLGTGIRYLIDVHEGMTLGDKHVVANCEEVLDLIPRLEFKATVASAPYRQLEQLCRELKRSSAERLTISAEEAERLERIGRRVRDGLFAESEKLPVHIGSGAQPYQIVLTVVTVALLAILAALAPSLLPRLDHVQPWLIAAAVAVMALTGIWTHKGLRAPGLWLGFIGLLASLLYAATGGGTGNGG